MVYVPVGVAWSHSDGWSVTPSLPTRADIDPNGRCQAPSDSSQAWTVAYVPDAATVITWVASPAVTATGPGTAGGLSGAGAASGPGAGGAGTAGPADGSGPAVAAS